MVSVFLVLSHDSKISFSQITCWFKPREKIKEIACNLLSLLRVIWHGLQQQNVPEFVFVSGLNNNFFLSIFCSLFLEENPNYNEPK